MATERHVVGFLARAFARWTAFALVLTLALPGGALAQVVHRCRMSGRLVLTCCCHGRSGDGARLQDTDCCAGKAAPGVPVTAAPQPVAPVLGAPALVAIAPAPPPAPAPLLPVARALVPAAARAPPLLHPHGVYLEVCSFLI